MNRSEFVDFTKGVLITLMVIGHVVQVVLYRGSDGFWKDPLFTWIYMFHMPLFIGLSGYVARAGLESFYRSPGYVGSRVLSCMVPVVVWAFVVNVAAVPGQSWAGPRAFAWAWISEVQNSLWFLWVLAACVVLAALARHFGRALVPVAVAIGCVLLAAPEGWHLKMLKYLWPFFVGGYVLAGHRAWLRRQAESHILFATAIAASLVGFLLWNEGSYVYVTGMALRPENIANIVIRWTFGAAASLSMLGLLFRVETKLPREIRSLLARAGRDSIYIYILQGYVLTLLLWLASPNFTAALIGTLSAVLLGLIITALCAWAGELMVRSIWMRRLLFGRFDAALKYRATPAR